MMNIEIRNTKFDPQTMLPVEALFMVNGRSYTIQGTDKIEAERLRLNKLIHGRV